MSTTRDAAIVDGVETDGALELMFQFVSADPECVVVEVMLFLDLHHLTLC